MDWFDEIRRLFINQHLQQLYAPQMQLLWDQQAVKQMLEDAYARGIAEGKRQKDVDSQEIIRKALLLLHPDRFHGTPEAEVAAEVTRWLLSKRAT